MAKATQVKSLDGGVVSMPVVYGVADEAIAELKERFNGLTATTTSGYESVRTAIATTRKLRVEIEEKRVALKKDALEWGRKVDAEAKRLTSLLLEIEEPLKLEKQRVDDEKERVRREKEEAERARVEAILREQREKEEARARAEREAEAKRLAEERAALEAERAKLAAEMAAEAERQRAERERIDAEQRKVADQQRQERERIEAERRVVEEEKRRLERIEFERQAKERAEQQARERMERERVEAERRAAEQRRIAEAEAARVAALRPDTEKLAAWAAELRKAHAPAVEDESAAALAAWAVGELNNIADALESFGR